MKFLCQVVVLLLCWEVCFSRTLTYDSEQVPDGPGSTGDSAGDRMTLDLCSLFEVILFSTLLDAENLPIQLISGRASAADPQALWKDYTPDVLPTFYFLGHQKRQDAAGYNVNSFGLRFGKRDTKFNWNSFGMRFGKKHQLPIPVYQAHQILCRE